MYTCKRNYVHVLYSCTYANVYDLDLTQSGARIHTYGYVYIVLVQTHMFDAYIYTMIYISGTIV